MKSLFASLLFILATTLGFAQSIDPDQSSITFKVDKVEGTISGMQGTVKFDKNDLENSSFHVSIDPSTVDTQKKMRDKHLRSKDYFHVDVYPKISFQSARIKAEGDGYLTDGKLSLHGVSKAVQIKFTVEEIEGGGQRFVGTLVLDQKDYEMSKKEAETNIEIVCVLQP